MDVKVQSLNGKIIYTGRYGGDKEHEIDLSAAARGYYHVVLKSDDHIWVGKLILNR